ncbi:MAG TPA: helix-turn-helix transcriptional regulator [Caulobacteraceae bacterium]|nr:helix-turn-helix transcriptional regulator [Caulobacteraceae bacterium]
MTDDSDLSAPESRALARRVREELARRRISRQRLADEAKISLSTLEKALAGTRPFTLATLIRLEQALGAPLRPAAAAAGHADESLGAYTRAAAGWLEGDYLTLRPSFEDSEAVYAYRTVIAWDEAAACLVFREAARTDAAFTQHGRVALPTQSGYIHLVTNTRGQHRLVTLAHPTIDGELYGLLATLRSGDGGHLTPVATPIALLPGRVDARTGRIAPADPDYAHAKGHLDRVLREGFARLLG